jgi:hypothetical protein
MFMNDLPDDPGARNMQEKSRNKKHTKKEPHYDGIILLPSIYIYIYI